MLFTLHSEIAAIGSRRRARPGLSTGHAASVAGRCGARRRRGAILCGGVVLWCVMQGAFSSAQAAAPSPARPTGQPSDVAAQLDSLLVEAGLSKPTDALVDDETFLRRLAMDLLGEWPTPEELTSFLLDPAPDKRARAVERFLGDPRFGQNWARYWRDVILYRRTDDRGLLAMQSTVAYLSDAFAKDTPWDEIARSFITATGNIVEDGRTALLAAQWAEPNDVAAEVSRIFLGVQIQCAQCHDHPTDRWKRKQFHEFAAFFPRIDVRRVNDDGPRGGFLVFARDLAPNPRRKEKAKDKAIEHYMPDLEDASAQGMLMQPVFFGNGKAYKTGTTDAERRAKLADWLTAPTSQWFAPAYVNRLWSELTGQGFYEPVDDLGSERTPTAPAAIKLLSGQFTRHNFSTKWLVRTVASTRYYQRARQVAHDAADTAAMACPQRLRSDQLFSALVGALGIDEQSVSERRRAAGKPQANLRAMASSPRRQFASVFGYDPSMPHDDVQGSIAQALALMNLPVLQVAMQARSGSSLGELLASTTDDEAVITELYLRVLARQPRADELKLCQEYLGQVAQRREAFEDLLWTLVNSTEFLYRQ